jgi:hypothetical protein
MTDVSPSGLGIILHDSGGLRHRLRCFALRAETRIGNALGEVQEIDIRGWAQDTIRATLRSIRRAALLGTFLQPKTHWDGP